MSRADSHLHVGALDRIPDLLQYIDQLGLSRVGALSLPLVGATGAGVAETAGSSRAPDLRSTASVTPPSVIPNFNPEVLAAMRARPRGIYGFASFDNRALVAGTDAITWNPTAQVEAMYRAGFLGVKMWEGKPDLLASLHIQLDDSRLIAAFQAAGARGMPVLIHVADPREFWEAPGVPLDAGSASPGVTSTRRPPPSTNTLPWSYHGRPVPTFDDLIAQAGRVAGAAPDTTFIFPHLLFLADDLPRLSAFLADHRNALLDLAPGNYLYPAMGADDERREAARRFFAAYSDRIMMGSDALFLAMPTDAGGKASHTVPGLPGTSLADNLERFLRLQRFLETDSVMASPFPLSADRIPRVRGLHIDPSTLAPVWAETFGSLCVHRFDRIRADEDSSSRNANGRVSRMVGWR
jgi:predicted TIM-barrel fold metal-dependent hydrolase